MRIKPMRSLEERKNLLHRRAKFLQKQKEKRILLLTGSVSAALFVAVVSAVVSLTGMNPVLDGLQFTGASLLSESAGGYVLTAVVSFAAAVVITLVCLRNKNQRSKREKNDEKDD